MKHFSKIRKKAAFLGMAAAMIGDGAEELPKPEVGAEEQAKLIDLLAPKVGDIVSMIRTWNADEGESTAFEAVSKKDFRRCVPLLLAKEQRPAREGAR